MRHFSQNRQSDRSRFTKLDRGSEQELQLGDKREGFNVQVTKNDPANGDSCGDEIPLTDVHVRKDVEWREETIN